ncbi:MAG: endonuclease/exonuclease/phosphatase family protein [gamma proteobacterium symbiont of Lucinoma myriamae]|nr:endonuclease/exonuclease/phosphatase family protein [gamma proteobacterium symbiont of Lucinoma myriamae]
MKDNSFIQGLISYDIFFLSETHIGFDTSINIEGFQYIPVCRPVSSNNRNYGGLAILIRKSIRNGIKILQNTSSEYQWIKLLKNYFGLESDIFACFSYISPCFFKQKSDADSLEAIVRDINSYRNNGHIVLCGDLNARTGIDLDFIQTDNDQHLPLDPSYIIDADINRRKSEDSKIDDRGKQLIDLCISTRMRILNGRCIGDSFGKFTCQKPKGASMVHYAIVSEELLKNIMYFHVHPFKPLFSDCHSKLSLNLKASFKHTVYKNTEENMPQSYKWTKYSPGKFEKALKDKAISNKIKSFLNTTFDVQETCINQACDVFDDIVISAANLSLTKRKPSKSNVSKCKKWYDEDLYSKRRELNIKASKMFRQPFNKVLRNSYFK